MTRIFEILPADVAMPSFKDVAESAFDGDMMTVIILLIALLLVAAIVTIIVVAVRKSKKNKAENKETAEPTTDVWDE